MELHASLMAWLGLEDPLPGGSTHMICKLVLVVGKRSHFLPTHVSSEAIWVATGFLQRKQFKRARKKWQCLLWSSLENFTLSLLPYSVVTQTNPDSVWVGTLQGCLHQEVRLIEGHLEGWLPNLLSFFLSLWNEKTYLKKCFKDLLYKPINTIK